MNAVLGGLGLVVAAAAAAPAGPGVILLVEDEPGLLDIARRVLIQNGFRVIATGNPFDAASLCGGLEQPIRLLLTDMVMPGMNGLEVARQVRAAQPGAKVLYMSGYTEHFTLEQGADELRGAFLQKPFTSEALLRKVHELLRP